ncbi:MAG: UDP-N-acetylmuramoyl-tripeptide--D-alanyl-D-alanine ligase, partial [Clostridia bacterium]
MWIIISLCSIAFAILFCLNSLKFLNYFQLEGYENFFSSKSKDYGAKLIFVGFISILIGYIAICCIVFVKQLWIEFVLPLAIFAMSIGVFCDKDSQCKRQPLVFTSRIKRYIIAIFTMYFVVCFAIFWLGSMLKMYNVQLYFVFLPLVVLCEKYIVWLVGKMLVPLENCIKKHYIIVCKKELSKRKNLIKIGITGSYAKTSIKNILTDILSVKYKTYCTPHNFNTPMGICRAVGLMPKDTDIFVVEMGAKHKKDIETLCNIVDIDYALLSGINNQHIATFGSIENVATTKMEIAKYAQSKGKLTIFNAFDDNCMAEFEKFEGDKSLSKNENCFFLSPYCDENGSKFDLIVDGEKLQCNTVLLGIHNIQNILMAVVVAKKLGLSNTEIKLAIENIKKIPHRLELQKASNGITIIDDSYNSNVVGAKIGIDCLKMFGGRKIVATQGLVELGENEANLNKELGAYMANVADIVVA